MLAEEEPPHPLVSEPGDATAVGGAEREGGDRRGSLSPVELSRISSPSPGMSLAEMTRVTPEDQERWRQSRESLEKGKSRESLTEIVGRGTLPPRDRFGGSLEIRSSHHHAREGSRAELSSPKAQGGGEGRVKLLLPTETSPQRPRKESDSGGGQDHSQVESSSDTTLVGSQSQSDTGMGPQQEEGELQLQLHLVSSSSKKSRRSPRGKKSPKHGGKKSQQLSGKNSTDTSITSTTLAVGYTHVSLTAF